MESKIQPEGRLVLQQFGKNIKRLRASSGLTQQALAKAAGLTHNFINDIENGKKWISANTLAKLSEALNASPHQFFLLDVEDNEEIATYINDFNISLNKMVTNLTERYLPKKGDE
jgi:transcriptional regulator with XRE-family HTH domain